MGKKKSKNVTIEITGSENSVEEFLVNTGLKYEIIRDGEKTTFTIYGDWEKLNSVSLYIYTQFDYEHFVAIDENGHAFLCW